VFSNGGCSKKIAVVKINKFASETTSNVTNEWRQEFTLALSSKDLL